MNSLAAKHAVARAEPARPERVRAFSYVEDLNWPATRPTPDKKPARPPQVWVPGLGGQWEGATPTLQ